MRREEGDKSPLLHSALLLLSWFSFMCFDPLPKRSERLKTADRNTTDHAVHQSNKLLPLCNRSQFHAAANCQPTSLCGLAILIPAGPSIRWRCSSLCQDAQDVL